jgi:hypothetical protein
VRKKDGSLRFCVDYRKLNAVTKKDAYPLPNIDTTLLSIGRMEFAASLDLDGAYWQICMDPASIEKTAFPTPNGLYEWTVMPFGLCNAVSTFQRFIERVLRGLIGSFVHVYLDDILVFSESWSEHLSHLKTVFERLRQAGVKLKPSKCHLAEKEIAYLGHKLDSHGVRKDESKVSSVRNYPRPMNAIELRRFLGLVGYYRKFIPRFAMIARPLHALLSHTTSYVWTVECQSSFNELIRVICEDVTLQYPDFHAAKTDPTRAFVIQTDASREGIAGVLGQLDGKNKIRPISFVSRTCSKTESEYPTTELEALAVVFAVKKFSHYIIGIRTIVETDHSALVQMFTKKSACGNARVNKWAMDIASTYDLEFRHKAGKSNASADALSRAHAKESDSGMVVNAVSTRQAQAPPEDKLPEGLDRDRWVSEQIEGEFGPIYKYIDHRVLPPESEKAKIIIESLVLRRLNDVCAAARGARSIPATNLPRTTWRTLRDAF